MFQVSICYCFWFDLFVLFVSGFYLLLFLIWPFRTVCFRFLSVIVFDWPFRTVCFRFLSVIVFDWPFRTVCFRFLSVIVFDLTFSYCLFQVSICYCFWFDLFVLFVSGFYLLLFLIWPFRTVCFRFLSVIVFDLTFSYCLFQVSICYCCWFDLFVLFVSGFYLLLFLIWPFRTVCFRFLSVIVFDLTFSYCLFQVSICYCFLFDLFVLFVSGFYLLLFLIWPFCTVCFRFLSVIVIDLTFSKLFASGFYLLLFLIWLFSTVCFRILSVIVFDWPFRTVCFRFLSAIVFDLTFLHSLLQVSICYCFWFDLLARFASGFYLLLFLINPFVLFVSGFYLLLFLIWLFRTVCFRFLSVIVFDWPFRTVCFRFLSVIVFDLTFSYCLFQVSICYCFWLTFSYCLFQVSICYCFWFDLFVLFVSGFYLLLFLIWPFRTVCFRFLSVIVFDLTFSYCLFQVSICYCFWFDLFVLFVSGFYLLLFLIWPFCTVCFRFLSVIVIDLTFSYCLFQVSICYCFWFDFFVLFVSGFYVLLLLIWPFRTVCFRFLSVIVVDLTFSYCLFQVSICYCFWFDLFVLFVSGFYLLLFLIWPFRTVCFRFLSVIVFDLTFSYCLFQVSICYCFWFDFFVLFVSGFYLLLLLIWPFRNCLLQVSICYCFWFDFLALFASGFYLLLFLIDLFVLFVSGFYLLLFLIWPFCTLCCRFLSVIVFDLTF